MKRLFLILALLFAMPALAAEHVPSTTATATGVTLGTGFTTNGGGDIAGSGVYGAAAKVAAPGIIAGRTYKYTVNTTISAGTAQLYIGGTKHGNDGAYVLAPTTAGATAIADNFDTAAGLQAVGMEVREPDHNASFRVHCRPGQNNSDDMLLLKNKPGAAHGHQYWGNTGANAKSTYRSLRTTGASSCHDPRWPGNRTSYWTPEMLDGMGNVIPYSSGLDYYKMIPAGLPECQGPPDATHIGMCVGLPNGIRFIAGYNHAVGTSTLISRAGDPEYNTVEQESFYYECHIGNPGFLTNHPTASGRYRSITATAAAGCPASTPASPVYLFVASKGPDCWDGVNLDSPDHRSHMSYATNGGLTLAANALLVDGAGNPLPPGGWARCPTSHPYAIIPYSSLRHYQTDANFVLNRWHLSSDEQRTTATEYGRTLHFDYFEAWSPTYKATWVANCINLKNSCNSSALGDGTQIKGDVGFLAPRAPFRPRARSGQGRPMNFVGTRTYTGEFKAPASGELGVYAFAGFTGSINSWSITDVTPSNNSGPVTTTHTH